MEDIKHQATCADVAEALADILDGSAPPHLLDHLADCDECRDLRHEAGHAARAVVQAGADYVPAPDFLEKVLERLRSGPLAAPSASESAAAEAGETKGPPTSHAAEEPGISARAVAPNASPEPSTTRATEPTDAAAQAVATAPEPSPPRASLDVAQAVGRAGEHLRRLGTRRVAAWAIAAALAAAGVGVFLSPKTGGLPHAGSASGAWSGKVEQLVRAGSEAPGGLEVCDAHGACLAAQSGAPVLPGSVLRTDARTKARIQLDDGTVLALDRSTEVVLAEGAERGGQVKRGSVVADVAKQEAGAAHFHVPHADVEVLGTKLAMTASTDRAAVDVVRGLVRVRGDHGGPVDVRSGEEATVIGGAEPVVSSVTAFADRVAWSEPAESDDAPAPRGLGELHARKPGQTNDKEFAVRLAHHSAKVRIVDLMARTEIDEIFANDTDEELEGIFQFPLPQAAQVERLALEVDGRLVEGAFVERDRGAAIWRGVIQNAAPKAPKPHEEIIWVPGPWRDPALLEWQRGGRFELKIFPIPRRGSRRVVLTYTQVVEQSGGIRRYVYPLAYDPKGTTRVGAFDLDVQVLGADPTVGVVTHGYDLNASADREGRYVYHAQNFVPAGDLAVEYALPDRSREVSAWAYAGSPAAPTFANAPGGPPPETARSPLNDASPYVALSLRPRLPRAPRSAGKAYAIVVDSSRSMVGDRFARASRLAAAIVREMDPADVFTVLACDTVCRSLGGGPAFAPSLGSPGRTGAAEVDRFLQAVQPDGGSDLLAAVAAAQTALAAANGRELRIVYLGDGTPSVGPTRPTHLEAAVRSRISGRATSVIAVPIGSDSDTTSLQALARGGGGVVVPYAPGQALSAVSLDILAAAYGEVLRDPQIELPPGLSEVSPAHLDPIRAGGEELVVARMTGTSTIEGTITLRGSVAGERFERQYPLKIVPSASAGNAFVPRLFAATKVAELEQWAGDSAKPTVVELSKRFGVASRYTSLLVLESEAMFRAFGINRGHGVSEFTGETSADSTTTEEPMPASGAAEGNGPLAQGAMADAPAPGKGELAPRAKASAFGDDSLGSGAGGLSMGRAQPAPAQPPTGDLLPKSPVRGPAELSREADKKELPAPSRMRRRAAPERDAFEEFPMRRERLVPMRRVYDRKVGFDPNNLFVLQKATGVLAAESQLAAAPNSRDKTAALLGAYATTGMLAEARQLAARWSSRDALDPDALVARADLAAREGDRERAIRILGGLADLRPLDRAIQLRLIQLQDAAGNTGLACEHRLALADLSPSDPKVVASAIGCARAQGLNEVASLLVADAPSGVRSEIDRIVASGTTVAPVTRGDIQLTGDWSADVDVDVALIDAQGRRISWLGSSPRMTVRAQEATSRRSETLDIANLPAGNYLLEVTRASAAEGGSEIHGTVTARLGGDVRHLPFSLIGPRAELGTLRVYFTSHLEPVNTMR